MKRKKKYWGSDGTDPVENYYAHRTRVLSLLQNIITKEIKVPIPWILLRAPYASSKTSLMQESHKFFEDFQVISVSMLSSSNCKNDNFSTWLLQHADVGPDRQRIKTASVSTSYASKSGTSISLREHSNRQQNETGPNNFYSLLEKSAFSKPVLLWFDEVQLIYSAEYAISFMETLKRIITEHTSWNVKAIVFSGVYEDFVPNHPADITHRFGADVLYFDMEEIAELIEDFNKHNADFHISPQIVNELHKATGGHPVFVIQCLRNIEEMSKSKKYKFESEDWIRWKTLHFKTAINNSRTAQQLNNFYIENPGWQQIVQQLFMKEPARLASNDLTNRLIKSALICQAPGTLDQFTFGSPVIRMLLFEALLAPTLKARPIYRWFDKMVDFLTVSIPLMDDKLITNCLSTTIRNRQKTWKEAVWQNHFFASLYRMIPNSYSIDPEYSDSGGWVDYYVHGEKEQFSGSIELLITEFGNEPVQSEIDYILKHYYRFVPDPKKRSKFPQTYKLLAEEPFIVVNVSHKRPNIKIEGQLPMTYADLIIDDTLHTMTLYIDNFVLPLTIGVPTLLNLTTKKLEDFDITKYTPRLADENKWKITVNINQVPTRIPISPNCTISDLKNSVKERDSTIKEPFEVYEQDIKLFAKDTISEVINDGAVLIVKQLMETDVSSNVQ